MRSLCKSTLILFVLSSLILISLNGYAYNNDEVNLSSNIDIIIPDDYSTIKQGINHSTPGDHIFVRSGSYEESNITIDKKVTLIGEDANSTIIKGNTNITVIQIYANESAVSGFTINGAENTTNVAIKIIAENCTVKNIILNNSGTGVFLLNSSFNIISKNKISNCIVGIYLLDSFQQNISGNNISSCSKGIYVEESKKNTIENNKLFSNEQGIFVSYGSNNIIVRNDFISNYENARFSTWFSSEGVLKNKWNENYWDDSLKFLPKWIPGILYMPKNKIMAFLPWGAIDWNPVKEPSKN